MRNLLFSVLLITSIAISKADDSNSNSDEIIEIGEIRIGGFLQVAGVLSTTTGAGNRGNIMTYIGWGFIVAGTIDLASDIIADKTARAMSQEEIDMMVANMYAQAQIVMKDPSLASNLTIQDAINNFEMDAAPDVKAKRFAEIVYQVSIATDDIDYSEILGPENTEANREILERMEHIFGLATI